jgi:hypothetical protein
MTPNRSTQRRLARSRRRGHGGVPRTRPRRRRDLLGLLAAKRLLAVRVLLDDQRAHGICTQALPPLDGQLGSELEAAGTLYGLDGHLEVRDGLLVGDGRVGKDEGADGHGSRYRSVLGVDDLVEVRGHGDVGRVADDLVGYAPLSIQGIALGQVQRAGDDAHARVLGREATAEVLEVRPVVAVEALADLRAHVGQVKGVIERLLAPFGIRRGYLMATVVAGPQIVLQLRPELLRHGEVLGEDRVPPVAVGVRQRFGSDVLGHPRGISQSAIEGRDERLSSCEVCDGPGEAILEQASRVDGRDDVFGWDCPWDRDHSRGCRG